jgi:hypothetical protein
MPAPATVQSQGRCPKQTVSQMVSQGTTGTELESAHVGRRGDRLRPPGAQQCASDDTMMATMTYGALALLSSAGSPPSTSRAFHRDDSTAPKTRHTRTPRLQATSQVKGAPSLWRGFAPRMLWLCEVLRTIVDAIFSCSCCPRNSSCSFCLFRSSAMNFDLESKLMTALSNSSRFFRSRSFSFFAAWQAHDHECSPHRNVWHCNLKSAALLIPSPQHWQARLQVDPANNLNPPQGPSSLPFQRTPALSSACPGSPKSPHSANNPTVTTRSGSHLEQHDEEPEVHDAH